MKIIIHRGFRQIGGNIIEISTEKTHLLVDAGIELNGNQHPINLKQIMDHVHFDAVLISHYHADHIELLNQLDDPPPIYIGEKAYRVYSKAKAYIGEPIGFTPFNYLKNEALFQIGDICITPYLADHSALDSYSLLFESDGKTVLYTGDFRGNGRKSFDRYIRSLPIKVNAVICEGTTLGREHVRNIRESELVSMMYETIKSCNNQAFIMLSAMNIDRIVTAYKAAKMSGRIFLQDIYTASLTSECQDIHIPNPVSFDDVFAFTCSTLPEKAYLSARQCYGNKFIGREQIAIQKYLMCIRSSKAMLFYLKKLNEKTPLYGSVLIYSMWEGYKQQPEMQRFLNEISQLGIRICPVHTSGHADVHDIRMLINKINPGVIIPIHTENENWFVHEYGRRCIIHTSEICEV